MATDIDKLDRKMRALVREATKGLVALRGELSTVLRKLDKGEVDKAKTLAAANKVMAYMKKFTPVTKIQNSPAFDKLSPETRAQIVWMDATMGELLGTWNQLKTAKSDAAKDPEKDFKKLLKAIEKISSEAKPPTGVGTLVKVIKKANDPHHPGAQGLAILPMAILLWMILDMIARKLKQRPKD